MTSDLTFAIAQCNVTVGDLKGNGKTILGAYKEAAAQGASLVIFPELALIGYPPEDLALSPDFRRAAMQAAHELANATANGPAMIVGSVWEEEGRIYNAALLMDGGKITFVQKKTCLPNYGIFDEKRIFSAAAQSQVVTWRGHKLGILICEDIWTPDLAVALKRQGAEQLIVINASPFEAGKLSHRKEVARAAVQAAGLPLIYANLVGGQDDIVFDGGSFALSAAGEVTAQWPEFAETVSVIPAAPQTAMTAEQALWAAMKLGLADYARKNGFSCVVLGLSGGIDSALSAVLAADALGASNVHGVLLPSPYTSKESTEDALALAKNLGIQTTSIPITPAMGIFDEVLSPVFKESGWMENLAVGGNLQARLRGLTLMAMSNQHGWLLLSTGNKSEIAVGYSTLYGDSCGGYNVVKDLYKTQLYKLAEWRNAQSAMIPKRSITKAPTAELAPGQLDQDQLPPYELLDRILYHHIEERQGEQEIIALGFDTQMVAKVLRMVRMSEYKRRQSAPGVKLSPMLFGRDRRYPLTNKF